MLKEQDRQTPLLRALYQRLISTATTALPGTIMASCWNATANGGAGAWTDTQVPVWQAVPKDLTPPFVAFRDLEGKRWGTKTSPADDFTVNFLIVSTYAGYKELSNIANAVLVQLTRAALDLSPDGLRVVLLRPVNQPTAPLQDGRTVTRVITFRIIVEDLASQDPQQGG